MALTEIPIELSSTPGIVDNSNATAITIGSDESVAIGGSVSISHDGGDSLTLTKTTTEPSLRLEGDTNKDFVITVSGELLTITQNDGGTDILTLDHDTGAVKKPLQPAFLVRPSSTQANIPIAATTTILLGTEVFDQGSNFASNTFTAPVTGRYQFDAAIYCLTVDSATEYVQLALRTSNRLYYYIFSTNTLSQDAFYMSFPLSVLADMDAGDTATVELQLPNSGTAQMDVNAVSSFSGHLVA